MIKITDDIYYVGVDDLDVDLFEGMYSVPDGMRYNSYLIMDDKIAVTDSVDKNFGELWLRNIDAALGGRLPDYIIVNHMEPDHSANIKAFADKYPDAKIIGNSKTFVILEQYFGEVFAERKVIVNEGDVLTLGKHKIQFIFAPMVHWPEVMMSYDITDKILFSADAFGTFGTQKTTENWADEARRYYTGIVGKYGMQVQSVLKKASALQIDIILPLHGPELKGNISYFIDLYNKWSGYIPEIDGIMIAYTSVYGHTRAAVEELYRILEENGCKVAIYDLVRTDRALCVAEAFRYGKLVLASTTYNADIFPAMREFIDCLTERNYQNRTVAFIENGSWAPVAAKLMSAKFSKCKNLKFADTTVKIHSALNEESIREIKSLALELTK